KLALACFVLPELEDVDGRRVELPAEELLGNELRRFGREHGAAARASQLGFGRPNGNQREQIVRREWRLGREPDRQVLGAARQPHRHVIRADPGGGAQVDVWIDPSGIVEAYDRVLENEPVPAKRDTAVLRLERAQDR